MVVMKEIGVYIIRRQNTVAHSIATCPSMDLFLAAQGKLGMCLSRKWWEKTALDILGIKE